MTILSKGTLTVHNPDGNIDQQYLDYEGTITFDFPGYTTVRMTPSPAERRRDAGLVNVLSIPNHRVHHIDWSTT